MRLVDAYKIKQFLKEGMKKEEILHHFRNDYSEKEVLGFIPTKKKAAKKKAVSNNGESNVDM